MTALGPYASFIGGSYALVALVVTGLIAGIVVDYRRQLRRLRALEEAGILRRSARNAGDAA